MRARNKHSIPTCPISEGNPEQRLLGFIDYWRREAESIGIVFVENSWEVTFLLAPCYGRPRINGRRYLHFTKTPGERHCGEPLWSAILDFTKAYCVPFLGHVQISALTDRLDAFRHLGAALGDISLCNCTISHLEAAATTLCQNYGEGAARNRCVQLELIAEFLATNGMVRSDLDNWSHGCPDPSQLAGTAGQDFEENAAEHLPSPAFLAAIPKGFACAVEPADVLVTTSCLLLRFMPSRIFQVINMEEKNTTIVEEGGRRRMRVMLPGAKRSAPRSVLLPYPMTPVAEFAFERMHRVTVEPRAIKRWYDQNPSTLYLPAELEHLRSRDLLTVTEASLLLGIAPTVFTKYAERAGLEVSINRRRRPEITFEAVELHILSKLPRFMRDAGGRGYHPLMLLKWRSLTSGTGGSPCMFQPLRAETISDALSPGATQVGIYYRLGVDPLHQIRAKTHSLRHKLTTDASVGGLSDDAMTAWFGRANPRWTRTYDHATNADLRGPLSGVADVFFGKGKKPTENGGAS